MTLRNPIRRHPGGEVSLNVEDTGPILIAIVGWMLIISAFCVRISAGTHNRFDGDYAAGAAANAAERSLDLQAQTSTSMLLFGLGALILVLQTLNHRRKVTLEQSAEPAPTATPPAGA